MKMIPNYNWPMILIILFGIGWWIGVWYYPLQFILAPIILGAIAGIAIRIMENRY